MGKKSGPRKAAEAQVDASKRGIAEIRRQFEQTRRDIDPFRRAGKDSLRDLKKSATIGGFGRRLEDIFQGGALDPLIEERTQAVQGQLGAAGLNRSGQALESVAAIPTELGFAIEDLLAGRQRNLAGLGLGAATQSGQFGSGASQNIASSLAQAGQARSSGILAGQQAQQAAIGQGIGLLGLALSDPRLKKNVVKLADINDLGVYQWDWIDELDGTKAAQSPTLGFMADEVEEKYPEYTTMHCGYRMIAYAPLLALMEQKAA